MTVNGVKLRLLIAAGLIITGLGILMIWGGQSKATQVKLSNARVIKLGESRKDLIKSVGKVLRPVGANVYRYPGNTKLPAQVVVYMDHDKVSALMITRSARNRQTATDATVGKSWANLKKTIGFSAAPTLINAKTDKIVQAGYKVAGFDANSYYITYSCNPKNGDHLTAVAIALKGKESLLKPLLKPRDCSKAFVPATK